MAEVGRATCAKAKQNLEKVKSPRKSRGLAWKNSDVLELLEIMQEETILYSLDNANTPKAKRAIY